MNGAVEKLETELAGRYIEHMADPVSIFDITDEDIEERALLEAEADIAAGRVISNEAMCRWLASWGTDNPLPPPECGE
ncbi:hypothetical protein [Telmatospirillum sp.]|uniref:hypothetical protein n=1 Tax=Telmatospirillum sp. TaxID=2079197 RepID=UPI002840BD33|nr:hypothetical protein [Telmatospirillum sp.]MDR3435492.1 CopG family transcriptional regulator [Telmatospirillum sp.]